MFKSSILLQHAELGRLCEYSLQADKFIMSSSFVMSSLWSCLGTEISSGASRLAPSSSSCRIFQVDVGERLRGNSGTGWRKASPDDSHVQQKWDEMRVWNRKYPFNVWKVKVKRLGEVQRADHHGCGSKRVAGTLKVVPLDAVQLPYVLSLVKVHAVEVGWATGIKPPTTS